MDTTSVVTEGYFLNQAAFLKAAEYVEKEFLSKPYIGGNSPKQKALDRAVCLLENGEIVELSGAAASQFLKIIEGGLVTVNVEEMGRIYQSEVAKIIYRPNHDISHAIRLAAHILVIKNFLDTHHSTLAQDLDNRRLERLQLMMLFCEVGRQHEIPPGASPLEKEKYYLTAQKIAAKAFFDFVEKERPDLYAGEDKSTLYHHAWIIELMGTAKTLPPLSQWDKYTIMKEMKRNNITLPKLNDALLSGLFDIMNMASALELLKNNDIARLKENMILFLKEHSGENKISAIKKIVEILQFSRGLLDKCGEKKSTLVQEDAMALTALLQDNTLKKLLSADETADSWSRIVDIMAGVVFKEGNDEYHQDKFNLFTNVSDVMKGLNEVKGLMSVTKKNNTNRSVL